jgi:hypothetical protein
MDIHVTVKPYQAPPIVHVVSLVCPMIRVVGIIRKDKMIHFPNMTPPQSPNSSLVTVKTTQLMIVKSHKWTEHVNSVS